MAAKPAVASAGLQGSAAAIVLNWNGLAETASCCNTLSPFLPPPHSLLVVDNGSTEHDAAALRNVCPGTSIIETGGNLGFAGGVNFGIRSVLARQSPDFFWLINNDVRVTAETLPAMLAAVGESAEIGIVSADIPDGAWRLTPVCRIPVPAVKGGSPDYVSGACMLIRRQVIEAIGLFDEDYFFFFEDADFCRRARLAGWRLAVAVQAGVRHAGASTIGRDRYKRARYYRAGHRRFLKKTACLADIRAFICLVWRLIVETASGRSDAIRGNLDGWRDV